MIAGFHPACNLTTTAVVLNGAMTREKPVSWCYLKPQSFLNPQAGPNDWIIGRWNMVPKSDLRYLLSDFVHLAWLFFLLFPFFHGQNQKTPCTCRGKRGPVNGWSSGIFCPEASLSYFERVRFVGENGFYSNHEECRDQDAATGKFCVWVFVEVTTKVLLSIDWSNRLFGVLYIHYSNYIWL